MSSTLTVTVEVPDPPPVVGQRVTVLTGRYAGQAGRVVGLAAQVTLDSGSTSMYLCRSYTVDRVDP